MTDSSTTKNLLVDHITLTYPAEDANAVLDFYINGLDLSTGERPSVRANVTVLEAGISLQLAAVPRSDHEGRGQRHVGLVLADLAKLETLRVRMEDFGAPTDITSVGARHRFFMRDPAGNLLEFSEAAKE